MDKSFYKKIIQGLIRWEYLKNKSIKETFCEMQKNFSVLNKKQRSSSTAKNILQRSFMIIALEFRLLTGYCKVPRFKFWDKHKKYQPSLASRFKL